jgi:hypothetical protein
MRACRLCAGFLSVICSFCVDSFSSSISSRWSNGRKNRVGIRRLFHDFPQTNDRNVSEALDYKDTRNLYRPIEANDSTKRATAIVDLFASQQSTALIGFVSTTLLVLFLGMLPDRSVSEVSIEDPIEIQIALKNIIENLAPGDDASDAIAIASSEVAARVATSARSIRYFSFFFFIFVEFIASSIRNSESFPRNLSPFSTGLEESRYQVKLKSIEKNQKINRRDWRKTLHSSEFGFIDLVEELIMWLLYGKLFLCLLF